MKDFRDNYSMFFLVFINMLEGISFIFVDAERLRTLTCSMLIDLSITGADPGFQVRGGGALKKIAPSGGRRENCWVFRVKNHDFTTKNLIFSNFRGARAGCAPPLDPPLDHVLIVKYFCTRASQEKRKEASPIL